MQLIVKVLTPGAPEKGWGVSEIEPGLFGLKGVAGSRENPIPVQEVNAVGLLIGDPLNPSWEPGSHLVTSAQTRIIKDLGYSGTFIGNGDTAEPSIIMLNWDSWPLNVPYKAKARISVGTDQTGFAQPFDESKSLIIEIWFARTGAPQEKPTIKVRFSDGDRLITQKQFDTAGSGITKKGNFFFSYWSYAGTYAEFVADLQAPSAPVPAPEPVPQPPPNPPSPEDTLWIEQAIREVEAAELEVARIKERLALLKHALKGKL